MPQGNSGLDSGAWGSEWVNTNDASLFADRTRSVVEAHYKTALSTTDPWATARDALFTSLMAGFNSLTEFIGDLSAAIAGIFGGTLTDIAEFMTGIVTQLGLVFTRLFNAAGQFVADIGEGIVDAAGNTVQGFLDLLHWVFNGGLAKDFDAAIHGNKTVVDVIDKAEQLKTTVYQTDVSTQTNTDFFNKVRVLPTWVGGRTDDVNLPHSFITGTATTVATSPSTLGLDGRLVLIPVVAGQDRSWSAVKFGITQMTAGATLPGARYFYGTLTSASTTTVGTTKVATLGLPFPSYLSVGDTISVAGFGSTYAGYNGTWTVSAKSDVSPYSVSYVVPALLPTATSTVLTTVVSPNVVAPGVTIPAALLMAVYDVDETTGAATKVIDLGNVKSQINSGSNSQRNLQSIALPSPINVKMGEIFYIGILQLGDAGLTPAGATALSYAPSSVVPYSFNTGTYPKRVCLYYNSGTLGVLPASFTDSQTSGSSSAFWGAFGDDTPNVIVPTVSFFDNFTGTNGATLDSQKWTNRYGQGLQILSNRAAASSSNGTSISTYKFKTNYLKQTAQCTIATQSENIGRLGHGGIILCLRGDGFGKFIYLRVIIEIYGISWRIKAGIYTSLSYSQPGTQLSGGTLRNEATLSTGTNPANGNTWKFIADGYTYVGYRNGTEFVRWADQGFAFAGSGTGNANFKEVGIGAFYVSEYSTVDNWTVVDASA
jgi:hypothetical protein